MESVRAWVRQADIDDGERPGTTTVDSQRIKELEHEARELRRVNAILESASQVGFLRGRARPPTEVRVHFIDAHRGEYSRGAHIEGLTIHSDHGTQAVHLDPLRRASRRVGRRALGRVSGRLL